MDLENIEIAEQSIIKVNAKVGKNIIQVGTECIAMSRFLKLVVELYWNGRRIKIYVDTEIGEILKKAML